MSKLEKIDSKECLMPLLYEELTSQILNACFEVIHELGAGFLESVYQNALAIALRQKGLRAVAQVPLSVSFRDEVVGNFVADLLVEDKVIVELKAVSTLVPAHQSQVINYLKATGIEVGLLVNFGNPKLDFNRLEKDMPSLNRSLPIKV
jgi:GxxExxY protein